jgi:hypothetical protein
MDNQKTATPRMTVIGLKSEKKIDEEWGQRGKGAKRAGAFGDRAGL